MVAVVVTTLVVSLVLGLAQIVMPEESEHKRDLLLAWMRYRERQGKTQARRSARLTGRGPREPDEGTPVNRETGRRGFTTASVRQLSSRVSSLGRIGPRLRSRPNPYVTWVAERSHAWIMHVRRHARDHERLVQHPESLIPWAAITLMTRLLTHGTKSLAPCLPRRPPELPRLSPGAPYSEAIELASHTRFTGER